MRRHLKLSAAFLTLGIIGSLPFVGCTSTTSDMMSAENVITTQLLDEKDLDQMVSRLEGSWDNVRQVLTEIKNRVPEQDRRQRYAMRYTEINVPALKGRVLAIENYDDGDGFNGDMQRVSVHRFMLSEDRKSIIHEIVFLKDKTFRKNLAGNLKPLATITEDDIRVREDCRLYWKPTHLGFEGATERGACITNSYTDRDILVEGWGSLETNLLMRHDRNFEMSGEEILRPGYQRADIFDRVKK